MSDELLRFSFMSHGPMLDEDGAFVLVADAEAHEREALEKLAKRIIDIAEGQAVVVAAMERERAIRDCIAAVEDIDDAQDQDTRYILGNVSAALRALLENPIQVEGS